MAPRARPREDVDTDRNRLTIAGYEGCALDYARSTAPASPAAGSDALRELLRPTSRGSHVLEIGSGPGWDADWLEAQGLRVRRTDAADAFVDFQNARGRTAERLDVLRDPLGGPYDAVVALYVFQHIERRMLRDALQAVANSLRCGGALLFSIREGVGDEIDRGSDGATYHVASWQRAELDGMLDRLGFRPSWSASVDGDEGRWLTMLCIKTGKADIRDEERGFDHLSPEDPR